MGHEARANQALKKKRAEIPIRVLKAIVNLVTVVPLLLIFAVREGYARNELMWEIMDWSDDK